MCAVSLCSAELFLNGAAKITRLPCATGELSNGPVGIVQKLVHTKGDEISASCGASLSSKPSFVLDDQKINMIACASCCYGVRKLGLLEAFCMPI